jgi:hypothetical protein
MPSFPALADGQIEALAKVLGECGSGSDIARVLQDRGLGDNSGESTKWRRLYAIFKSRQQSDHCANRVLDFTQAFLSPARFIGRSAEFESHRSEVNTLQSETEKSEHKGYAALLKGCFAAVRNPPAHTPKLLWQGEEDAADHLSLISLLHRKLDGCVKVQRVN